ncbi:MAG: HAMP domain-containing protein [Chloroflexi bacterium]|nr:HAMP domain-containing protein [Chloroflexota bacterium]MCI0580294.1 HAMP domain-containing protein [Chloroflexota bacterium]MCI0648087.1 HAMP domain-containing protein [Chloroflexota bacterium]MCI0730918.1 HAMP domain-containing protein [Chloroflexota bacterium]
MTTTTRPPATKSSAFDRAVANVAKALPGAKVFSDLKIGRKLTIGFGILVFLALLLTVFIYQGSQRATVTINRTGDLRMPMARASSSAQINLLKMLAAVRGYLALGDPLFIDDYYSAEATFENDLAQLRGLSADLDPLSQLRLSNLEASFEQWRVLPEQLFDLRDDRLAREPAYRVLAIEGVQYGGNVLIDIQKMIESQALREPTQDNVELLKDMANFQGSFAALFSGLRNYVNTQNRIFRQEYEVNLVANDFAWQRLEAKRDRGLMTEAQLGFMDSIAQNRADFLDLPESEIFPVLESERSREDLYLFAAEAVPLNETMVSLLDDLTASQQQALEFDLNQGRSGLETAVRQTLAFGLIALLLGVLMSVTFREFIAGPVRRLTGVAEEIRAGNLEAQAQVESADEIGILAQTFNRMTTQLRQTLRQVRKEKNRADSLLNVVIPIGVELSSEKDFNRLLEKMLVEAKTFCRANAGILYLRTEDDKLQYVIVRNDAENLALGGTTNQDILYSPLPLYQDDGQPNNQNVAAHVAISGVTINIANSHEAAGYHFHSPSNEDGYYATSYLTIPLKNSAGQVAGVLQLLDARDPESGQIVAFDQNLQQMMESFSSLAVAALEAYIREQALRQEIQQLRIEIDAVKREQQVEEIVESDFFRDLQTKAREMRQRGRQR